MASERARYIQLGALFLISILVLISGVLWFKNFHFAQQRTTVLAAFPSTSGLIKGDNVEVQGVPSGHVSEVRYEDGRSLVTMEIDRGAEIRVGSRFVIENVGIMGQKMVAVYPAKDGPVAEPGTVFRGGYQPGIPQLLEGLGTTLESVDRLAVRLESVMAS
ncbi:MAG: MCE family protein, partial [Candidatus Eisenbacteria bacterium]|nr:MCE family protein [Candidatus Eisenbacteria bacterium]